MDLKKIPFGTVDNVNVLIEIPAGSANKYEFDESIGALRLDFVFKDLFFPHNYGLIPGTLAGDGDHADAYVISSEAIMPGSIISGRVIGMIELLDRGEEDNKFLIVPNCALPFKRVLDLKDLDFDYKKIFGEQYAGIEIQKKKKIEILGYLGKAEAEARLKVANENYKTNLASGR